MKQNDFIISANYKELDDITDLFNVKDSVSTWKDIVWDNLKDKVRIRYVKNVLLDYQYKNVPYKKFLDLAKIIHIESKDKNNNKNSYVINNADMKHFGISEEELFEIAENNTNYDMDVRLFSFKDYLNRLNNPFFAITKTNIQAKLGIAYQGGELSMIDDERVLILTKIDNTFGSSYCFLDRFLNRVRKQFNNDDFYIVPLSIHQIMYIDKEYLTDDGNKTLYEAEQDLFYMLNDLNGDLSWQNVLTYNVYYYSNSNKSIMMIKNLYK